MQKKRFNLPPLDLIQGFEAAARNLSFTKAAEELFITQSAVSRQIRGLEEHLGIALFERRHRALVLTEQGRALYQAAADLLERLQGVTDRLRADGAAPAPDGDDHQRLRLAVADPAPARLHRACTPTSMCASPPATSSCRWSAAWSTWRCATVRRRRRRRARSACSARSCFRSAARRWCRTGRIPCARCRTSSTTRCCTWTGPAAISTGAPG